MNLTLNTFVYSKCLVEGLPFPMLPVVLTEQYGQCAEDIIIASILRAIAVKSNIDLSKECFLEIGGNHPISTSATFLLKQWFGMSGVIVEANPELLDNLRRVRPDDSVVHAAVTAEHATSVKLSVSNMNELSSIDRNFVLNWQDGKIGERFYIDVPAMRINQLFEQNFPQKLPIYMSIDVEGVDLTLLKDLDFKRFRPTIIQTEPSDHYLPNNSQHMLDFMKTVDYELLGKTNVNLIFLDRRAEVPKSEQQRSCLTKALRSLMSAISSRFNKRISLTKGFPGASARH